MKTPTLDVVMRVAGAFDVLPETLVRHVRQGMGGNSYPVDADQTL